MASTEAQKRAQRRYAKTPKGRRAAARPRKAFYEQRQVRLVPKLRELRRTYWRAKKRCQRQGIPVGRSSLVKWLWETILLISNRKITGMAREARLSKARRIAKELDADPKLC